VIMALSSIHPQLRPSSVAHSTPIAAPETFEIGSVSKR
jgi:hypothetical protein